MKPDLTSHGREHGLTRSSQYALLVAVDGDGVQWDAEERLGVSGAAFWNVLDVLRGKGIVGDDYCLTQFGASLRRLIKRDLRTPVPTL